MIRNNVLFFYASPIFSTIFGTNEEKCCPMFTIQLLLMANKCGACLQTNQMPHFLHVEKFSILTGSEVSAAKAKCETKDWQEKVNEGGEGREKEWNSL